MLLLLLSLLSFFIKNTHFCWYTTTTTSSSSSIIIIIRLEGHCSGRRCKGSTGPARAVAGAGRTLSNKNSHNDDETSKTLDFPAENANNGDSTTKKGMTCKNCLVGASELLRSVQVNSHPTYHYLQFYNSTNLLLYGFLIY